MVWWYDHKQIWSLCILLRVCIFCMCLSLIHIFWLMSNKNKAKVYCLDHWISQLKTKTKLFHKSSTIDLDILTGSKLEWFFTLWQKMIYIVQPIWKICSSNWIISPGFGMKITNIWNHQVVIQHPACCIVSTISILLKNGYCCSWRSLGAAFQKFHCLQHAYLLLGLQSCWRNSGQKGQ